MPKIIAFIIELVVCICALWMTAFLSALLHELGHALGYMLTTRDRHWHIRVGWGKRLLNTKALTVRLIVFDGFFAPAEKKIRTKTQLITTLAGGPAVSLLLTAGLLALRFGGISFHSDFLADSAVESLLNFALATNLMILVLSVSPIHYFHGGIKGLASDGLQIVRAIRKHGG